MWTTQQTTNNKLKSELQQFIYQHRIFTSKAARFGAPHYHWDSPGPEQNHRTAEIGKEDSTFFLLAKMVKIKDTYQLLIANYEQVLFINNYQV